MLAGRLRTQTFVVSGSPVSREPCLCPSVARIEDTDLPPAMADLYFSSRSACCFCNSPRNEFIAPCFLPGGSRLALMGGAD